MRHYRDIPQDRILKFKATPRFKGYEHFFTKDAVSHPAKMNINLLRWILSTFTETNNIVLDPMAGTGSTIILAASMGRHGIAVEYENKFCKMIDENIDRTNKQRTFAPRGEMVCIKGDARELSKYLKESDVIISSPPYSNIEISSQGADGNKQDWNKSYREAKKSGNWENFKAQMKKQKEEQIL